MTFGGHLGFLLFTYFSMYCVMTFGGHLGFLRKMKKCEDLENRKIIFDPQGSTTVFCAYRKNFSFHHFWPPSWILAENKKL